VGAASRRDGAIDLVTPLCGVTHLCGAPRRLPADAEAQSAEEMRNTAERCYESSPSYTAAGPSP